jgi:2-polyprenyl-6-methoxyphenol hydroxylase-like FAD-dependent oxidoreductase
VICLGDGRTYWWAAVNAPQGEHDDPAARRDALLSAYRGWPFDVPEAIDATPSDAILRNDFCNLRPLKRWGRGLVTLLGDAAHPMTPNLGQSACSALEDAVVLARHLARAADVPSAFAGYERERVPRTRMLVTHSWVFGVTCRWRSRVAVALRDGLLALTPRAIMVRSFRRYVDFDAGPLV